jgi:hypothetical protein
VLFLPVSLFRMCIAPDDAEDRAADSALNFEVCLVLEAHVSHWVQGCTELKKAAGVISGSR